MEAGITDNVWAVHERSETAWAGLTFVNAIAEVSAH